MGPAATLRALGMCRESQAGYAATQALCYFRGNASLLSHLALRKAGVPFQLRLADRTQDAQHHEAHLLPNPNGRITVLVDGDLALFEAAAIALHLADQNPDASLAPPLGAPERAVPSVDGPPAQRAAGRMPRLVLSLGNTQPILLRRMR